MPCNKRPPGFRVPRRRRRPREPRHPRLLPPGTSWSASPPTPSDMAVAPNRTTDNRAHARRADQRGRTAAPLPGRSAYRKVRERASFASALVSVAALIDIAGDGTVGTCRVALGE